MNVKDYAKQFNESYKKAFNRIQNKYLNAAGMIDEDYLAENRRIKEDTYKAKNNVSSSSAISLANARNALLDKGLERSGDAVNTEIKSALSKNNALADIDVEANRALQENALSRSREKSNLLSSRLEEETALEADALEKLINQYNADREYDRKVAESEEDTRRWNLENEQKRAQDERDYLFDREKFEEEQKNNAFEREYREKEFSETQKQNEFENFMAEKEYNLSLAQKDSDKQNSASKGQNSSQYVGVTPEISPQSLIKTIVNSNTSNGEIRRIIYSLLNDTSIASDYKAELRYIAFSMGYIN